ncbi:hypothetical protein SRABI134_04323 [Peribacillus sp. Bi134]|nr:hypothetical protein SRABI134_04323 [Peribacillus sp. Bi134]
MEYLIILIKPNIHVLSDALKKKTMITIFYVIKFSHHQSLFILVKVSTNNHSFLLIFERISIDKAQVP